MIKQVVCPDHYIDLFSSHFLLLISVYSFPFVCAYADDSQLYINFFQPVSFTEKSLSYKLVSVLLLTG